MNEIGATITQWEDDDHREPGSVIMAIELDANPDGLSEMGKKDNQAILKRVIEDTKFSFEDLKEWHAQIRQGEEERKLEEEWEEELEEELFDPDDDVD
jgi:hypothetical protein